MLGLASDFDRVTIDEFVKLHASQIANAFVLGGPAAISSSFLALLQAR